MYWQTKWQQPDQDQELKEAMLNIRKDHKNYGYRRVHAELKRNGWEINIKRVHRIYKVLELQVESFGRKYRKINTYKGNVGRIRQNKINRRFESSVAYQKITTDTTEFKYYELDLNGKLQIKKLYLDPFMDLFNLEIVSFKVTLQPNGVSMLEALKEAIEKTKDCKYRRTFHSDRGWAYQMPGYQALLKENKIFQSMSRKGNCYDNAPIENFFSVMKQEMYYGKIYRSYEELKIAMEEYISYYNEKRIKEKLGYMSPQEYKEWHYSFVT